jgi:peptidoglycan-N-acetylmuramic acid deacetylase
MTNNIVKYEERIDSLNTKKKSSKIPNKFISVDSLILLIIISILIFSFTSCSRDNESMGNSSNNIHKEDENNNEVIDNEQVSNNEETENQQEEIIDNNTEDSIDNEELELEQEPELNTVDNIPQGDNTTDNFDANSIDSSGLSNETKGWSFKRNSEHEKTIGYNGGVDLEKYGAYYIASTNEKVIYLTFDAGYENGYTEKILDALKNNNVKATFFLTKPYIKNNVNIVKRMKEEGHIVGNHSVTHPSFPDLTDEKVKWEIEETAKYFEEKTGYKMDLFFRPPKGEFSERTLYLTRSLGYKTIFWSLTYLDWDRNKQPGKEYAYNHVMENYHNGAIPLLHAVSRSNAEAMEDILKGLLDKGYRFGSLYELD